MKTRKSVNYSPSGGNVPLGKREEKDSHASSDGNDR